MLLVLPMMRIVIILPIILMCFDRCAAAATGESAIIDPLDATYPWDCSRKWPTIGMVIPLFIPGRGSNYSTRHYWPADWLPEYHDIFLRSKTVIASFLHECAAFNSVCFVFDFLPARFRCLFLRYPYKHCFFIGVLMYWPFKLSNTTITIMCDEERRGSREFKEDVTDVLEKYQVVFGDKFPRMDVKYNAPLENVYRSGHDRQQYLTFTADYYTDAEYVAFMDSDAFLHTFVDREGEIAMYLYTLYTEYLCTCA